MAKPTPAVWRPFERFFKLEASGSIILLFATVAALAMANSGLRPFYEAYLHTEVAIMFGEYGIAKDAHHWINDGLMAIFFFLVGLEIKRELVAGELRDPKRAALPIGAAIGGMIFPALIYFIINRDTDFVGGWGIPMATDIAFALGALALLGKGLPKSLRVFLAAAAIVDDLGAVLVIAVFYTETILMGALLIAGGVMLGLIWLSRSGVQTHGPYILLGIVLWVAMLKSGVHATIAGVALAMTIPHKDPDDDGPDHSLLEKMEHALVPYVTYAIMPIFAFANAGVPLGGADLTGAVPLGIILGLLIGKQIGIMGVPWLMIKSGIANLPKGANWLHMHGVAWLAAIGFTMALFIADLASLGPQHEQAKLGIMAASAIAGVVGLTVLGYASKRDRRAAPKPQAE